MSTDVTWQTDCSDLESTLQLAEKLGDRLKGGEVIELVSDLGGGKTSFVRGLAKGMGSTDQVSSPTFTLNNQYKSSKLVLYHFDFYRLVEPGIMREELAEILVDSSAVTVIEWADIIEGLLPSDHITITITATGETSRRFNFEMSQKLTYVLEGLQ